MARKRTSKTKDGSISCGCLALVALGYGALSASSRIAAHIQAGPVLAVGIFLGVILFIGLAARGSGRSSIRGLSSIPVREYADVPKLEAPAGYVYVMRDMKYNKYKIGRTINPKSRLRDIQRNEVGELRYVHLIRTDDAVSTERALHQRYAKYRIRMDREWFEFEEAQLQDIRNHLLPKTNGYSVKSLSGCVLLGLCSIVAIAVLAGALSQRNSSYREREPSVASAPRIRTVRPVATRIRTVRPVATPIATATNSLAASGRSTSAPTNSFTPIPTDPDTSMPAGFPENDAASVDLRTPAYFATRSNSESLSEIESPTPTHTAAHKSTSNPAKVDAESATDSPDAETQSVVYVRSLRNGANARVRACPGTVNCRIIGLLSSGESVRVQEHVLGEPVYGSTAWIRFEFEDSTGFIHSSLVTEARPPSATQAD